MQPKVFCQTIVILFAEAAVIAALSITNLRSAKAQQAQETSGSLQVVDAEGKPKAACPLKHTDVKAEISGFLARVVVTQEFENPFTEKIEAVYTFPLPQSAAVDDMTMTVGDRTVRGKILRREEAQAVYEAAKTNGQRASLLDQERPNIFTQSVANILPGEQIKITISYVETLQYEAGTYEFVFPMVVGPRYIPGGSSVGTGKGVANGTEPVPDAARITPAPQPPAMRAGHDISLDITLDAGVPVSSINARTHEVDVTRSDERRAHLRLRNVAEIPNKDFILRYEVTGQKIEDALLIHSAGKGGYFTFILQPPERVTAADVMPKELVFVLDTSGSMSGFPIEKAKETMKLALDNLYPTDTFNLITFSGDEHILFPAPVPATKENLARAQKFLESREGSGGTEMMKAVKAALDPSDAQNHVRIVCFMTDGYVGNDFQIVGEIQKHPNARVFAFGIGNSVNRYLLDNMARQGRGEVEYVGLGDDGSAAARRFYERVHNPLLTDISIDWNGLPVEDVYPTRIPDLFGAKPVVLNGRYTAAGKGTIRLRGKLAGRDFVREIPVDFSGSQTEHDVLATLWARTRVDDLLSQDFAGAQQASMKPELKETITQLGLEYRLLTQFTSFVAVEEMVVTDGGQPRRIDVPVEVPEGVNREAVFADRRKMPGLISGSLAYKSSSRVNRQRVGAAKAKSAGGGGGSGSGSGSVVARGVVASKPVSVLPPPSPALIVDVRESDAASVPSPADQKRAVLAAKFSPALLAVIDRLKNKDVKAGSEEAKFVRDGKAEIQIWLTDKSEQTLAELRKLGFEVVLDPKTAKLLIGRLPLDKLEALVDLTSVRYVAPEFAAR